MPKLLHPTSDCICFYCGKQATWVSVNTKIFRCLEKITQCPGHIEKAEAARKRNTTSETRKNHMKRMSINGNKKLKELHTDLSWVSAKGEKISEALRKRGGHSGKNNPMFGKTHTSSAKKAQSNKASNRDHNSYKKATETKIKRGIAVPKESKSDWEFYREQVTNFTSLSWKFYQHLINPAGLIRGKEYELDHMFSITEGFLQEIPPEIIGHFANLELIPKETNRTKRTKCSITKEELYEAVNVSVAPFSPSSDTVI